MKKLVCISAVTTLIFVLMHLSLNFLTTEVFAASEYEEQFPAAEVLFAPDFGPDYTNSAEILEDGSISLTPEATYVNGAIWSKPEYQLDLLKDFSAVFYLNFGDNGGSAGDGTMFVLQGTQDFLPFTLGGASLGALGSEAHFGSYGIPNSFGVEFDLYYNSGNGDFDHYVGRQDSYGHHVAYLWPGDPNTYQDRQFWEFSRPPRTVQHYGTEHFENLSNGEWYRFAVNWDATEEILTYQVANKEPITVAGLLGMLGTTEVNWGFTGSAASAHTSQRVRIERIDGLEGLVEGSFELMARHADTQRETSVVYPGDTVEFDLKINYLSGSIAWRDLALTYTLDQLVYEPGSLLVRYETGEEEQPEDAAFMGNTLSLSLKDLNEVRSSVTVSFSARVPAMSEVSAALTHSAELNAANDPLAVQFFDQSIGAESNPSVRSDQQPEVLITDGTDTFTLTGTWQDSNTSLLFIQVRIGSEMLGPELELSNDDLENTSGTWEFTGSMSKLYYGVNILTIRIENSSGKGSEIPLFLTLKGVPVLSWGTFTAPTEALIGAPFEVSFKWRDADSNVLRFFIAFPDEPPSILGEAGVSGVIDNSFNSYTVGLSTQTMPRGSVEVLLFAQDLDGNQSNDLVMNLEVKGGLFFVKPPGVMAEASVLYVEGQEQSHKLQVEPILIKDTREEGAGWQLKLRLEQDFSQGDKTLFSTLFYRDAEGVITEISTTDAVLLAEEAATGEAIELAQEDDAGFYIRIPPGAFEGSYAATLRWTLV